MTDNDNNKRPTTDKPLCTVQCTRPHSQINYCFNAIGKYLPHFCMHTTWPRTDGAAATSVCVKPIWMCLAGIFSGAHKLCRFIFLVALAFIKRRIQNTILSIKTPANIIYSFAYHLHLDYVGIHNWAKQCGWVSARCLCQIKTWSVECKHLLTHKVIVIFIVIYFFPRWQ